MKTPNSFTPKPLSIIGITTLLFSKMMTKWTFLTMQEKLPFYGKLLRKEWELLKKPPCILIWNLYMASNQMLQFSKTWSYLSQRKRSMLW
jgi:hypothetical protein